MRDDNSKMIRNKKLLEDFAQSLETEVDIREPNRKDLVHPLDKILTTLYESNSEIHRFQSELSENRRFSLDDIEDANNVIFPAEIAVEGLERTKYDYAPYKIIAAKVVDAGDKLDKTVEREMKLLGKDFREKRKVFKRRLTPTLEVLEKARLGLGGYTDSFFELFEKVYTVRGLDDEKIAVPMLLFKRYKIHLNEMHDIDAEISALVEEYTSTPVSELGVFVKYAKRK